MAVATISQRALKYQVCTETQEGSLLKLPRREEDKESCSRPLVLNTRLQSIGKLVEMSSAKSPKVNRQKLEATITILKDEVKRLHKEVLQVRTELKIQRARSMDLTYALQEKEQELEQQQKDYDQDMKDIISKLLLLEADFRKEQAEIKTLLEVRDATIESLTSELMTKTSQIESLQKKVESLKSHPDKDDRLKLEKKLNSQKLEIDNLRNANARLLDSLNHVRLNPNSTRTPKLRRSSTPAKSSHGKNQLSKSELPEWKEELSAFF